MWFLVANLAPPPQQTSGGAGEMCRRAERVMVSHGDGEGLPTVGSVLPSPARVRWFGLQVCMDQ